MLDRIRGGEVLVIGLARSGVSTVRFLLYLGAKKIIVNDNRQLFELGGEAENLQKHPQVTLVAGGHPTSLITERLGLIIKSPGVPPHIEILSKAKSFKIPIMSEIELAYPYIKAPIIGITGTNGKTTTTMLVSEIFKRRGGIKVFTAGNIGTPLSEIALEAGAGDIIIAELSSFQLDDIMSFRPCISVILNITDDHLDYHKTKEKYIGAKEKILINQGVSDTVVLNADDGVTSAMQYKTSARPVFFSQFKPVEGFCIKNGHIGLLWKGRFNEVCLKEELILPGEHNLENCLAAATAAWAGGVDLKTIGEVLRDFNGVEHRLELVRTFKGVTFINDSKGTNPEACQKALEAFPGHNKILIAGGKDKGADFKELIRAIKNNKVKLLILLGETAEKIKREAQMAGYTDLQTVKKLEDAVTIAWNNAVQGDLILLSPACASWDMFSNYEERGRCFKDNVKTL